MKRIGIWVVLIFGLSFSAFGEETNSEDLKLTVGYYGETIVHPGLRVGLDYTLAHDEYNAFIVGTGLSVFYHRMNVIAPSLDIQAGYRLTLPFGLYFDLFAGLGYLHTFLDGPIYQVDSSGNLSNFISPGYPGFKVESSLGIGWNFTEDEKQLFMLCLRLGIFGEYPVNYAFILHPVVQLTVSFPIL